MVYELEESASLGGSATITLPSVSGRSYSIEKIFFSYSGVPLVPGELTVKINSTKVLDIDITTGGNGAIDFQYNTDPDDSMEIKLSGINVQLLVGGTAKLNVYYNFFDA